MYVIHQSCFMLYITDVRSADFMVLKILSEGVLSIPLSRSISSR